VFFFTTAHGGILAFNFATRLFLGLGCPLMVTAIAKVALFLDQQFLDDAFSPLVEAPGDLRCGQYGNVSANPEDGC
jgi:hypothetical protein